MEGSAIVNERRGHMGSRCSEHPWYVICTSPRKDQQFFPAYGDREVGGRIPANADLLFTVELIEVDPNLGIVQTVLEELKREIPGLPFKLQAWQLLAFLAYLGVRVFARRIGE